MSPPTRSGPPPEVGWDERRLSFGEAAADYDAWRPGYPDDALRWLLGDEPRRVLDLAAGTGRIARAVLELGHDVIAVEPDPGMRALAERALGPRVFPGAAEEIPLAAGSVDAVLVGQAWHWFDPERALAEVARVLAPGGFLGLLWNLRDESLGWMRELGERVGGEDRVVGSPEPARPADVDFGSRFDRPSAAVFAHGYPLRVADLARLVETWSFVRLSPHRDELLAAVDELTRSHPDLVGAERVAVPLQCVAVRAAVLG